MIPRWLLSLLLLGLLATSAAAVPTAATRRAPAKAPAIPPAPGIPNFVNLASIEGIPPDSAEAHEFMAAFRGAFSEGSFETERESVAPGDFERGIPISNRFRLLEGFMTEGTFDVSLRIDWARLERRPQGPAADVGARVRLDIVPPAGVEGASRDSLREAVMFMRPLAPRPEFFAAAGRELALLVLETLHRSSGDLDAGARLAIARVERRRI